MMTEAERKHLEQLARLNKQLRDKVKALEAELARYKPASQKTRVGI